MSFLTSSSKSNSPVSSCFGLGRESTVSDVAAKATEGERIVSYGPDIESDDKFVTQETAYWRWKARALCRE